MRFYALRRRTRTLRAFGFVRVSDRSNPATDSPPLRSSGFSYCIVSQYYAKRLKPYIYYDVRGRVLKTETVRKIVIISDRDRNFRTLVICKNFEKWSHLYIRYVN